MGGGGSENSTGLCIILDHRKIKHTKDKDIVKDLFRNYFNYEIKEIYVPKDTSDKNVHHVCDKLKQLDIKKEYAHIDALILFVFGECDPCEIEPTRFEQTIISNTFHSDEYLKCFKETECDVLKEKPKILIQHMWHKSYPDPIPESDCSVPESDVNVAYEFYTNKSDISFKDERVLQVFSRIIDKKADFENHGSLFIESMNEIFRKFSTNYDIIELFTKVLREVEINQAIEKKMDAKASNGVVHRITFTSHLDRNFTLLPCQQCETGQQDDEITLHPSMSEHTHYSLDPDYEGRNTYSKFVLEKLSSMKIELKEQKLQHAVTKYPMDKNPRGFCLLINMSNDRLGSFLDEMRMHQLFEELYFKTFIINNRSHEEIEQEVQKLAASIKIEDHPQCLFIILMAHGGLELEDERYNKSEKGVQTDESNTANTETGCNDKEGSAKVHIHKYYVFQDINNRLRSPNYLFEPFEGKRCSALSGKPKICVLQTCFGVGKMEGCKVVIGDFKDNRLSNSKTPHGTFGEDIKNGKGLLSEQSAVEVPHEKSDWYKLNATIEGYKSYRTQDRGSYVIDSLDQKFRSHAARADISQLMTMVTGEVSKKGGTQEGQWQQPECRTYFNGSLYLNPGYTKPCYPRLPTKKTLVDGNKTAKMYSETVVEGSKTVEDGSKTVVEDSQTAVDGSKMAVVVSKTLPGSVCWSVDEYVAVGSNTNAELNLTAVSGSEKNDILFDLKKHVNKRVSGIISGCMLSHDIHVIIYTHLDGHREIVAVHLKRPNDMKTEITTTKDDSQKDTTKKIWKQSIDLTNTIVNPLAVCQINNDCFGVLRGTPNKCEDVTIEVYTNETILQIMDVTLQSKPKTLGNDTSTKDAETDATPIQAEYVIRVNYATGRKINIRDKLCYSCTKFYILSFYECIVYKVNVKGKIEDTKKTFDGKQPVALLRGPNDTIDVACSHAVYIDVFGKNTDVATLEDCYASNMLVVESKSVGSGKATVSGKVIVLNDPGMDHNTFVLIPQFQGKMLELKNEINGFSGISQQCVWPHKQGFVAVGSAESCHISLACSTSKSLDQVFVDGINSAAKIVQAIHLNDSTHLVMFETVEHKQLLKLINIDTKIEMHDDFKYTVKNKAESTNSKHQLLEKPAAIFGIDQHTFGVVCNISGNKIGIQIFNRKPKARSKYRSLLKEVKLEKPFVGYINDSACVDVNGEFYISNCEKHEVKHFDVNGALIETLETKTSDAQTLAPYKVMVDKNNTLFILCQEAIYRLTPEKKWAEEFKFETKSKPDVVPEQTSDDGQPDSNMPSPSADQTEAMDSSPSASGALPETTGGSWDVCFNGNFMYSVFDKTLDVYGPKKCTGKPQEAETEPFTDPKTPESTTL